MSHTYTDTFIFMSATFIGSSSYFYWNVKSVALRIKTINDHQSQQFVLQKGFYASNKTSFQKQHNNVWPFVLHSQFCFAVGQKKQ